MRYKSTFLHSLFLFLNENTFISLRQVKIKYYTMKHLLLIMAMLCIVQPMIAESSEKEDHKELYSNTRGRYVGQSPVQHAPARTDILLIIEDSGITIRFNGDFGPGYYQLSDAESGYTVSGVVVAEAGGTELVSFPVSLTTSFDFYIEFEDGSWSHLAWGE